MYFTRERVEVTKRIKDGRTIMVLGRSFGAQQTAEKTAKRIGSYYYDLFGICEVTKNRIQVGFAVPK